MRTTSQLETHLVDRLVRRPTPRTVSQASQLGTEKTLELLLDARGRFAFDFEVYRAIDVVIHRLRARLGARYRAA